jgi:hypothetical protein
MKRADKQSLANEVVNFIISESKGELTDKEVRSVCGKAYETMTKKIKTVSE